MSARAKRVAAMFADDDFQTAIRETGMALTQAVMEGPAEGREAALAEFHALKRVIARLASWKMETDDDE